MLAVVAEILAHRTTDVRHQILQRCRFARRGTHDNRVFHRIVLAHRLDDLRNRRLFLTNRDVDAIHIGIFLIDNRIDGNGCFPRFAVADDELALTATNRNEGIERFETRLKRFIDGLTRNNPGRLDIDGARLRARYRTHAVYRLTQRIDHATHERFANRYRRNATRAAHHIALADQMRIAQQRTTDVVFFEVEHQSVHIVRKRQQLTFHGIFQAINASRTVATRDNRPRFRHFDFAIEILNLLADYLTDFFYIDSHPSFPW